MPPEDTTRLNDALNYIAAIPELLPEAVKTMETATQGNMVFAGRISLDGWRPVKKFTPLREIQESRQP